MAVEVYLNFNGNCREAVAFYEDVLIRTRLKL